MTDTVSRPFAVAIAYCLAYEQQGGIPEITAIEGFLELAQRFPEGT